MTYLIDSDQAIDFLRAKPEAVSLLRSLFPRGLAISLITYGEIYEGVNFGPDPPRQEREFNTFLEDLRILSLNEPIMRRFARIRGELRGQGLLIRDPDLLIAATAIEYDLTLVTRNVRHFERIPGLALHHA